LPFGGISPTYSENDHDQGDDYDTDRMVEDEGDGHTHDLAESGVEHNHE
jgi:hypothetical protein